MIIIGTLESKINKTKILRSDLWFLKLQLSLKSDSNVPMDGDRGPYIFLGEPIIHLKPFSQALIRLLVKLILML